MKEPGVKLSVRVMVCVLLALTLLPGGFAWTAEEINSDGAYYFIQVTTQVETANHNAYYGGIQGRVLGKSSPTAEESGIPGVLVLINRLVGEGTQTGSNQSYSRWTVTGADGKYYLTDIPPGSYKLEAITDWYRPAMMEVAIKPGKEIQRDLNLNVPFGRIGGTVTNYTNQVVEQATVLVFPQAMSLESANWPPSKDNQDLHITLLASGRMMLNQGNTNFTLETDFSGMLQGDWDEDEQDMLQRVAPYQLKAGAEGRYLFPEIEPGNYWLLAANQGSYVYQQIQVIPGALYWSNLRLPMAQIVIKPGPNQIFDLPGIQSAKNLIKVFFQGNLLNLDVAPMLEDGRVLVPLRMIAEILGSEVDWEGNGLISIRKNNIDVKLQLNSQQVLLDNRTIKLDVAVREKNGRTMVPLRFLSETLGASVTWDAVLNAVHLE